ncbi:MAG: PAS domain S-box protein [Balneolaceae bacterium]|nr:PAS domain S-box protein [Balneolaceae bacterium]
MSYSIVFNIDQQLDIQEKASELHAIVPGFDENTTLNLYQFFEPDNDHEFQQVIEQRSANPAVVHGSLVAIDQQPPARLYVHCIQDENSQAIFECVLVSAHTLISNTPPEISSSLFKHNPLPFYCFDTNGKFIHVNDKLIEFTGLSEPKLLQLGFKDFIHPDDQQLAQKQFDQALEGEASQYELRVFLADETQKTIRVNKFPRTEAGLITGVYGIFEDITEEHESEARWRELVEQSPFPVSVYIDGNIAFTNSSAPAFFGYDSVDELIGRSVYEFIPDEDVEYIKDRQVKLESNETLEPAVGRIYTKRGDLRHVVAHSRPIVYKGKQAIQSVIFDITDMKKQKEIIEKSLKEKETLLKEIHHRVKNNLAIVSGLLELQMKKVDDPNTIDVLKDSQNRILSIALVHQKLYQVETLDEINVGSYVEELISSLINSFTQSDRLSINVHSQDVFLDIEQAVPCSLIINEAVVNAIKHGFDNAENGSINVFIDRNPSFIQIKVEDNGIGIPEDINLEEADSLGITLIKILSQQLDGTYLFDAIPEGGTRFILRFPHNQS